MKSYQDLCVFIKNVTRFADMSFCFCVFWSDLRFLFDAFQDLSDYCLMMSGFVDKPRYFEDNNRTPRTKQRHSLQTLNMFAFAWNVDKLVLCFLRVPRSLPDFKILFRNKHHFWGFLMTFLWSVGGCIKPIGFFWPSFPSKRVVVGSLVKKGPERSHWSYHFSTFQTECVCIWNCADVWGKASYVAANADFHKYSAVFCSTFSRFLQSLSDGVRICQRTTLPHRRKKNPEKQWLHPLQPLNIFVCNMFLRKVCVFLGSSWI